MRPHIFPKFPVFRFLVRTTSGCLSWVALVPNTIKRHPTWHGTRGGSRRRETESVCNGQYGHWAQIAQRPYINIWPLGHLGPTMLELELEPNSERSRVAGLGSSPSSSRARLDSERRASRAEPGYPAHEPSPARPWARARLELELELEGPTAIFMAVGPIVEQRLQMEPLLLFFF